jgi:hypothetical protein
VFDGEGTVGAWRTTTSGAATAADWSASLAAGVVCEPAVADVDGNGRHDLILLTADKVHALQADGTALNGFPATVNELFPLPDTTRVVGPVVVCDADGDRANEVFLNTNRGHLIGLDGYGRLLPQTPFLWGDQGDFGLAVGSGGAPSSHRILWLVSSGGRRGAPLERQLYNGRIAGYTLSGAGGTEDGTSEWLAAGGGPRRAGPVGQPRDLGAQAPLAASAAQPIYYPNPLTGTRLTVRFYSQTERTAKLAIYNLAGEQVVTASVPVTAGQMNEYDMTVPDLASGYYICRLERETANGVETTVSTLAVAR